MVRHLAETLVLAAIGGAVFTFFGVPAGWMSGAIIVVATAALIGRPMLIPAPMLRVLFVVIGISLGAVVTPETVRGIATYPVSVAMLIMALVCLSAGGTTYLRLLHGWDMLTAFLASSPGAMSQVLGAAAELGAELRAVAIAQSLRVVVVAVCFPAAMTLLGLAGEMRPRPSNPLSLAIVDELTILVALSTAGALLFYRFRVPGGLLFGALFTSAVLHGSGLIHAVVPPWVANAAMVVLGGVIGARFANTPLRLLSSFLGAAFGSIAVLLAIAGLFVAVVIGAFALPAADVTIAFAPGSVDAMMLLAIALSLDPIYVGAHHVTRIMFVSLLMPVVARWIARKPVHEIEPVRERPTFQD